MWEAVHEGPRSLLGATEYSRDRRILDILRHEGSKKLGKKEKLASGFGRLSLAIQGSKAGFLDLEKAYQKAIAGKASGGRDGNVATFITKTVDIRMPGEHDAATRACREGIKQLVFERILRESLIKRLKSALQESENELLNSYLKEKLEESWTRKRLAIVSVFTALSFSEFKYLKFSDMSIFADRLLDSAAFLPSSMAVENYDNLLVSHLEFLLQSSAWTREAQRQYESESDQQLYALPT